MATMREMATTGDLTRRIGAAPGGATWEDEDARLLATTFNTMTDSIARFQREAGQRERLSSLGRLSTVVAHEIRNPLMIIKTALRKLRGPNVNPEELRTAVADIDEETARLNRLVSEVLDFARPIKFDLAPTDLNALCQDAAKAAAGSDATAAAIRLELDPGAAPGRDRRRAAAAGARQHPDERPRRRRRPIPTPRAPPSRSGCAPGCRAQAASRSRCATRARALQVKISVASSIPTSRPGVRARGSGSRSPKTSWKASAAASAFRAGQGRALKCESSCR